jgi:RNA polymerase sigma-B factor
LHEVRSRWPMSAPSVCASRGAMTSPSLANFGTNAPGGVADGIGRPEPASQAAQTGVAARSAHRLGYEHLAPLFVERCGLPEGHPRRKRLRDELIAGHLPLARNIARKYAYRGDNPEDLEQVASVGLVLAVDRFDVDRGIDFLSFAVPTINGEVLRYFRDRASTIRIPRRLRSLQAMIYDVIAELGQRHGRAPRPSEIAAHLDVDVEVVLEALSAQGVGRTASLDEPSLAGDGSGERLRFESALAHVEGEFDMVEHCESLAPLLAALPDRERRILLLRFFGGLTQTEIGTQLGISQMHVSRLLSRTLIRLRHQLASD